MRPIRTVLRRLCYGGQGGRIFSGASVGEWMLEVVLELEEEHPWMPVA